MDFLRAESPKAPPARSVARQAKVSRSAVDQSVDGELDRYVVRPLLAIQPKERLVSRLTLQVVEVKRNRGRRAGETLPRIEP